MHRRIFSILLVELLFIACAVQFVQAQDPHKPSARQVVRKRGVPIRSLLRPGETRLEVVSRDGPPQPAEPPSGTSEVAWLTQISRVVMRARVVSSLSMLTPDEDWIDTLVKMKILQVLKTTGPRPFNVGQEASFMEEGGSLDVEGGQIDAIVKGVIRYEVGKEYLIFANLTSANDLVTGPSCVFEIGLGRSLQRLLKTHQSDNFSGSSLDSVLEDVQRYADVAN
jgi:hypothetical protein